MRLEVVVVVVVVVVKRARFLCMKNVDEGANTTNA